MNHPDLIHLFISRYVQKDRRDRAAHELLRPDKRHHFIGKLNHTWAMVLDMRRFTEIPKAEDYYAYALRKLGISEKSPCYALSHYEEVDDHVMGFKDAYDQSWGRGFATLLMGTDGSWAFLETEVVRGPAQKFIGRWG